MQGLRAVESGKWVHILTLSLADGVKVDKLLNLILSFLNCKAEIKLPLLDDIVSRLNEMMYINLF